MSRVRCPVVPPRRMAGLSLIEMMIALVMALIVAAGIISVFSSTSSSNKVQAQMATLQEEGRFAIQSLRADLSNANGGYCSNSGGVASITPGSGLFLDGLRSPTIYAKDFGTLNNAFADNTTALTAPTSPQAFSLPSRMFMRGYDCGTSSSTCKPLDPSTVTGVTIPAMGSAVGDRVPGTDVLTIRYLKPGSGWAISATGSTIDAGSDGTINSIQLNPLPGEASDTGFSGGLAMLADCSGAQVFAVTDSGGKLTPNNNYTPPKDITSGAAPRVFDFSTDFQTVTYYLKVVCANGSPPCTGGTTTGELERRVAGVDQALVRGVERLDFRYGVIDGSGLTRFLNADEVDNAKGADGSTLACHLNPDGTSDVAVPGGMDDSGCLWRAVQSIQVNILMDGQTPLYTLTPDEMNYIYTPDGDTSPQPPTESGRLVQPAAQGFPNQLLRREFTTVVALRNFNP